MIIVGDADTPFELRVSDSVFSGNQAGNNQLEFPGEDRVPVKIHQSPSIVVMG